MSRTQKEKLETYTDASLQLFSENSTEESAVTGADDYIEVALEKRKKRSRQTPLPKKSIAKTQLPKRLLQAQKSFLY